MAFMSKALDDLYQFERNLRCSLDNEDWGTVAELDARCRGLVNRAIDEMSGLQDSDAQHHYSRALQELAELYQALREQCLNARDAVAEDLQKAQRGRQAKKVYTLMDV